MAAATTILSAAVGENARGKLAPNKSSDVTRVQTLLRKAFGRYCPTFFDGAYDDMMKWAITEFNAEWGGASALIEPNSQSLKRLNRLANPLELEKIEIEVSGRRVQVNDGGYAIRYHTCDRGPLPAGNSGFTVTLRVGGEDDTIDITDRPANHVMNVEKLAELLLILDRKDQWATKVECRAELRYMGNVVSTSEAQPLPAPVQPHNGRLLALDRFSNGPQLTYQEDETGYCGRMFAQIPGYSKYLFIYHYTIKGGGQLETNPRYRGFDCTTYVGTTCAGSNMHMAASEDLANSLGASPVSITRVVKDKKGKETTQVIQLEKTDPANVKEFFAGSPRGYYLMFTSSHIVLVAEGVVHEFAHSKGGYDATPVTVWLKPYNSMKLTVRQLATRPARAFDVVPMYVQPLGAERLV